MAIKTLFAFTIDKEIEVEKTEEVDGGTLVKKVKEAKPFKFALRRPNRAIIDANELFYGVQYNEAVKAGLMPRALFAKRLNNDNGVFSNAQLKEQESLYTELQNLGNEITKYNTKPEEEHTENEKKDISKAINEYLAIQRRLTDYENAQQSMFDNTAENRARLKSILWYSLFLSYKENDKGELEPLYSGDTFESKLKAYDKIDEDGDEFLAKAAQKFSYFVTALYLGKASTESEFSAINDRLNSSFETEVEEVETPAEEAKVEEVKEEKPKKTRAKKESDSVEK